MIKSEGERFKSLQHFRFFFIFHHPFVTVIVRLHICEIVNQRTLASNSPQLADYLPLAPFLHCPTASWKAATDPLFGRSNQQGWLAANSLWSLLFNIINSTSFSNLQVCLQIQVAYHTRAKCHNIESYVYCYLISTHSYPA